MIIEDTESFENVFVSNYWYDADGERTVKTSGENIRRKRSHLCQPILSCRARWRVHQAYLHCRAGRKSFSEQFSISAHGESRFPNGLAFPRRAKVVFRMVWHFRAGRKSFSEWFDACANRLFIKRLLLSGKPSPDIKVKGRNPREDFSPFCYLCLVEKLQ